MPRTEWFGSLFGPVVRIALVSTISSLAAAVAEAPRDDADRNDFTVFMRNSGWCWFQDPRAIIHRGKVVIGGIEGNGPGAAAVGVYDLKEERIVGRTVVNPRLDRDDHNSPVFHPRPDGRLLTVYARHHRGQTHRYRVSDPDDYLAWSEEKVFRHAYPGAGNVTYMNLCYLAGEQRLYNFFRGISFNPCFVVSGDHGNSWGSPTRFIKSELSGRHRPYARYAGNGDDTVHVCFTDGHPRVFGNSIYYAAFRDGKFWKADGKLIKDLKADGPLGPSEADLVYKGSMTQAKPQGYESVPGAAWTSAIALDALGRPHIAYSLYLSNDDHRYRLASWDGSRWIDREVAYAGKCLYTRESSYTGLISLDPADPTYVVISTDVDPTTGKGTGGTHEIYRASINTNDDVASINWLPMTRNSAAGIRNIRPMVLNNDGYRVVLWQRGEFSTFTDYRLDTVGVTEPVAAMGAAADSAAPGEALLEMMLRAKRFQERGERLRFGWMSGTFYSGVMACYNATGEREFLDSARSWCAAGNWRCARRTPLNADSVCSVQTFLDVYFVDKDREQIKQINRLFEENYFGVETIARGKIGGAVWKGESAPFNGRNLWWWCDALYMAPPLMARLGRATGNPKYLDLMHRLYWDSVDHLYDEEERLFYRDRRFLGRKTPKGQPVFWGRGNGWVIGGLARTIDYIPEDDPMRPRYIKLFQDMMTRIVELQGDDGLWRSSLNEPSWVPMKETSCSSFFCFGLAKGINEGWLDRDTYHPAMQKAWRGLVACLSPEGKVRGSQPGGDRPRPPRKTGTDIFTQGAFLLAASEVYKLEATRPLNR